MNLPQVMAIMSEELDYFWTFAIRYTGHFAGKVGSRHIQQRWKPVVAFVKPPIEARLWPREMIDSGDQPKTLHAWQQPIDESEYFIEKLTAPNDLVVDPFAGSGTTLLAAKKLGGRGYLGCEVDSGTAKMARRRLAA